jgi:uncharacterized membrane protein YfcA
MPAILIPLIVFFAAVIQSLAGFGFALIVMPLAVVAIGLKTAAPLVAMVGFTLNTINVVRFRRAVKLREVLRLTLASALGVPIGVWALVNVSEELILRLMGLILVTYAVYSLWRPRSLRPLPEGWAYPAGFLAGSLSGAYNTPGPPVVVYGALRGWPKDEFRAVLHGLFFFNGILVVTTHVAAGRVSGDVLTAFFTAVPALLLGILLASRVDHRLNRERFRILVTVMILVLGLSMVVGI